MNILLILLIALTLATPADAPAFTWTEAFPPAGAVTWTGPGTLLHIRGGAIVAHHETSAEPHTTAVVGPVIGDQFCVVRDGEAAGCVIVPPQPGVLVFAPFVGT